MKTHGRQWLAGLLEGEGCFVGCYGQSQTMTPGISLAMTDEDVVLMARDLMTQIGGREIQPRGRKLYSGKTVYTVLLTGLPAVKVMVAVHPYMGARRAAKILSLITAWHPKKYRAAVQYRKEMMPQWL